MFYGTEGISVIKFNSLILNDLVIYIITNYEMTCLYYYYYSSPILKQKVYLSLDFDLDIIKYFILSFNCIVLYYHPNHFPLPNQI